MAQQEFNSKSLDAQLATILEILKNQDTRFDKKCKDDETAFAIIMKKQDTTNGRVTTLENDKAKMWGVAIGLSVAINCAGWAITHFLKK